jgi:hypothetical protein
MDKGCVWPICKWCRLENNIDNIEVTVKCIFCECWIGWGSGCSCQLGGRGAIHG